MGLLDKILGRGGAADDTPGPFDCERVKAAIGPLATALGALADAMDTDALASRKHVNPMVMAGRETRGWLRVGDDGLRTERQLESWVNRAVDYVEGLPPKRQ